MSQFWLQHVEIIQTLELKPERLFLAPTSWMENLCGHNVCARCRNPPLHQAGGHVAPCGALHHAAQGDADVGHEGLIEVQRLRRDQRVLEGGLLRPEPTGGVWQGVQGGQREGLQVWAGGGGGGGGGDDGGGDGL